MLAEISETCGPSESSLKRSVKKNFSSEIGSKSYFRFWMTKIEDFEE
jgi:hypothetical protein